MSFTDLQSNTASLDNSVAIVGMSAVVPGAPNLERFWENLRGGVESICFLTDTGSSQFGVATDSPNDSRFVPVCSMMDGIDRFDAEFFDISARDAELMDPQHRIFLEQCWAALESAGRRAGIGCATGVFAGATVNTYHLENLAADHNVVRSADPLQLNIANGSDFLTTRVSYKLNLKGPSYTLQSACSTSLVAVHAACQSLLNHECDMALAGGISINIRLREGYLYLNGGMMSPDGHCRAFDEAAAGTVFGGGAGVVTLRRLADALADRDTIRAVIRGSAVNNDGSFKASYSAPSIDGQAAVIVEALANAGVEAESISYIETHGTGTALGDPVEIRALSKAFGATTKQRGFCAIGSVKTNIGHLDAAAGVVGLIKTVLSLEQNQLPPSLHYHRPNPEINFTDTPFFVNSRLTDWARTHLPRRAGVSAFGVGGTNAHLVLEEAPQVPLSEHARAWQLLLLSAKSAQALEDATRQLADHLDRHPDQELPDVAYTLQVGRLPFPHRRMFVCETREDAIAQLRAVNLPAATEVLQPAPSLVMSFRSCVTSPIPGMQLRATEAAFCDPFDRVADICRRYGVQDIGEHGPSEPACFALEYAIAQLLAAWGVCAREFIGDGWAELTAAAASGSLGLEEALRAAVSSWGRHVVGSEPQGCGGARTPPLGTLVIELTSDVTTPNVLGSSPRRPSRIVVLPNRAQPQVAVLNALGKLWLAGVEPDWEAFCAGQHRRRVPLPTYPFQRRSYWIEPRRAKPPSGEPSPERSGVKAHPRPDLRYPYVEPASEVEQDLAHVWQTVMGLDRVGATDNFFDLGGDSLLALQVISAIEKKWQTRVSPADLYDCLTVRGLAAILSHENQSSTRVDPPSRRRQYEAEQRARRLGKG